MVASKSRLIENRYSSSLSDGVFVNDPLLLRLASDVRFEKTAHRDKSADDDIFDAMEFAQTAGWDL